MLNVVALENFDLHTSACTCSLGRFNNSSSILDMHNLHSAMAEWLGIMNFQFVILVRGREVFKKLRKSRTPPPRVRKDGLRAEANSRLILKLS